MKSSIKSKISHFFKGKTNKLEKFPTYDQSYKAEQKKIEAKNKEKVHRNKKNHKRVKADIKIVNNNKEFPLIPSPSDDSNESSKLTAQEFAKAVGIKILHRTDEEEDEDCDCEYCKTAYSNINTITSMEPSIIDNNAPTQPIPNVALNQYTVNTASIFSSNSTTFGNNNKHIDIPPLPSFNFNSNDRLIKCSSNNSLNTSTSNHSTINSRTIGTPGYYCHCNSRKNSISKVIDMSLFVPPSEQEIKNKGIQSSSLSINSTPEPSSIQAIPPPSNEMVIGGSLDRNRNVCQKKTYYGLSQSNSTRERTRSHSVVNNRNRMMNATEVKASPVIRESSNGSSSHIQFKIHRRRHSVVEFSNVNSSSSTNTNTISSVIPSSPNKRPYPSSLASSSSSTTLSSSLSLTHISKTNLNSIPSSQSSSQASLQKANENSLQSSKLTPNLSSRSLNSIKSPLSSSSSVTPVKPHTGLKITRSVTISEGTRRAEIDVKPLEKDEVRVYTKGRFTITCEHSRRLSGQNSNLNKFLQ